MKKCTARDLIRWYFGPCSRVSARRIDECLARADREGWVFNFRPGPEDYDRDIVLIRKDHLFAPLVQATQDGPMPLPKGLVESRFDRLIGDPETGRRLGNHGLLITSLDTNVVTLRGINPELAVFVNGSRYPLRRHGYLASRLVEAALGLPNRPRRLSERMRRDAVAIFKRFDVDARDLLAGQRRTCITSVWTLPATLDSTPVSN